MTDEATKLPLESANIVNENITKLGQLFPEIMADGKIDFDKLREVLGDSVDDGQERYAFTCLANETPFANLRLLLLLHCVRKKTRALTGIPLRTSTSKVTISKY